MLERLAGDDENLWDKAALAAQGGIDARIRLWEGIYQKLGVLSLHAPPPDFVAVEALQ
jgi:hypothetical protein